MAIARGRCCGGDGGMSCDFWFCGSGMRVMPSFSIYMVCRSNIHRVVKSSRVNPWPWREKPYHEIDVIRIYE